MDDIGQGSLRGTHKRLLQSAIGAMEGWGEYRLRLRIFPMGGAPKKDFELEGSKVSEGTTVPRRKASSGLLPMLGALGAPPEERSARRWYTEQRVGMEKRLRIMERVFCYSHGSS